MGDKRYMLRWLGGRDASVGVLLWADLSLHTLTVCTYVDRIRRRGCAVWYDTMALYVQRLDSCVVSLFSHTYSHTAGHV